MSKITELLKDKGITQKEFAEKIGVKQSYISKLARNEVGVGSSVLEKIAINYPDINLKWFLDIPNEGMLSNSKDDESVQIPVNYIKVPTIPIHAQAGFLNGYGDEAYWDGLPTEIWEVDREYKGNYVVFEVKGDSMDDNSVGAILEGDRILCREIMQQHWMNKLHINKWNFVIVHREEGIIVKRITEHNVEQGIITCHSLNTYYDDFQVDLRDVIALYNVVDLKRNLRL